MGLGYRHALVEAATPALNASLRTCYSRVSGRLCTTPVCVRTRASHWGSSSGLTCERMDLTIEVDLVSKRMAEARLNGAVITANDAMTLVWFNTIFAAHVESHSLGIGA